ncbi:hypothetical protein N7509_012854 [Penicillium cosmopolitanum]|uniref:FAD-binding domain-containing protein n=1 Tax=Penicillium cosmopolitanum TaxID=1131564 RepID=A0A9W9VBG3_9EURO|nr:uncharacterized protein N7509_012854 [Penicillium cosmopolitanum]KAJ5375968.1 hypothetical protein N7509_012854 [Penicillium cosmopolitanum]
MTVTKYPESETDVLIIGAGPAGLMAAYWMARYGVKARIVDKRAEKVMLGHADGLVPRTLELFDSCGFNHRVRNEGVAAVISTYWGLNEEGKLVRQEHSGENTESRMPFVHTLLGQGRLEQFILDSIHENSSIKVERGVVAEGLSFNELDQEDHSAYPITIQLRTLNSEKPVNGETHAQNGPIKLENGIVNRQPSDESNGVPPQIQREEKVEIVKARYLLACDGARSWTRTQMGLPMEGSSTEYVWGVADVVPISNFPDIRRLAMVENAAGSILIVPRERNLMRLYVPMPKGQDTQTPDAENGTTNGRRDKSTFTPDDLRKMVQAILSPWDFDFKICEWFSAYGVGQRVASTLSRENRVFLAGDAAHSHSPKIGMGMNMSLQDGFNLGWKLALVAQGAADPSILNTYNAERLPLAKMLVEYDRQISSQFTKDENASEDIQKTDARTIHQEFEDFYEGRKAFYPASNLVHKLSRPRPGEKFPVRKLLNQARLDTRWTTNILESDGRFRLVVLAGDIRFPMQKDRVDQLGSVLPSILNRYIAPISQFDGPINTLTIHSSPWDEVEYHDFPEVLRPFDEVMGWAYDRIWSERACTYDSECEGKAYEKWGVDLVRGAVAIIRPDQYVGWVGELEDTAGMTKYFDQILRKAPTACNGNAETD